MEQHHDRREEDQGETRGTRQLPLPEQEDECRGACGGEP